MKKLLVALLAIAAIAVGYWLISPLFINKTVGEEFPVAIEETNDDAAEQGIAVGEPHPDAPGGLQLEEDMISEEDVMVKDDMPEMQDEPKVVSKGVFVDVDHEGTGDVQLINLGSDQGFLVRFEDLDVLNGPDLRVLLSKNANIQSSDDLGEYIELGKLKGNKGSQNYEIPGDVDPTEYASVVIYCKPFHVVFNAATLQ